MKKATSWHKKKCFIFILGSTTYIYFLTAMLFNYVPMQVLWQVHGSAVCLSFPAGSHVLRPIGQKQDAESLWRTQQERDFFVEGRRLRSVKLQDVNSGRQGCSNKRADGGCRQENLWFSQLSMLKKKKSSLVAAFVLIIWLQQFALAEC